jgi:hypothetical protein
MSIWGVHLQTSRRVPEGPLIRSTADMRRLHLRVSLVLTGCASFYWVGLARKARRDHECDRAAGLR